MTEDELYSCGADGQLHALWFEGSATEHGYFLRTAIPKHRDGDQGVKRRVQAAITQEQKQIEKRNE